MRLFLILLFLHGNLTIAQKLETVVQRGHFAAIKAVTFTNDGQYLLTGSRDKSIKLWHIATGREIRSFFGHTSTINGLKVSPDGNYVLSSSADKTAKIWEISTGKLIRSFEGHEDYLTTVDYSPDGNKIVTAGFDNEARIWDVSTGEILLKVKVNPDKGVGYGVEAKFSPDGKFVAFGNDNRTLTIFDLKTGEQIHEIKPAEGWCGGCATFIDFDKQGKTIVKASNKAELAIYDVASGEKLSVLSPYFQEFRGAEYSPNYKQVLMYGEDSIKVYNIKNDLLFSIGRRHALPITEATFSPDAKEIVSVSDDQTIHFYNAKTGEWLRDIKGYINESDKGGLDYDPNSRWDYYIKKYTDLKNDIALSPDGKFLAKGKIGNVARMWELQTGRIKQEFRGHEKAVLCMKFSKDGTHLITGSADNTIKLWEVSSGQALKTFKGHRELIFDLDFNDDESKIITASWDGSARIWDVKSSEMLDIVRFENGAPYQINFFNNDIYAFIAGLDKTLRLWELDSKQMVRDFMGHTDVIHAFDSHPSFPRVASVSWDGKVKVWDINTGLQLARKSDHEGEVYAVRYNNTGNIIATAGADRAIILRDANTGKKNNKLLGHKGGVTNLLFTPNDKILVSSSEDGEVKIWDVEQGKELLSYIILNQHEWMAINAEGYFNATDGALRAIAFVKGMESYSADQFFEQFYQPNLIQEIFKPKSEGINMLEQIEKSPPPKIEILAPFHGEKFRNATADLIIKATDNGGSIDEIKIKHNGKIVNFTKPEIRNGQAAVNYTLELVPGQNQIAVSAFSKERIESSYENIEVSMEGKVNSTLYIVSIGINIYDNPSLNLNYAKADAKGFSDLVEKRSKKLFDRVEVISLYDKDATRDNILTKLSALSKVVKPQDVLFFYYAGHGSMVDNNFYFIPTENVRLYSEEKLKKNGIYAGELQEKLQNIAALKQLVVIDACQSGGSVELLAQRGAGEERALAQLSRSTGVHVLAAAGSEQFAIEFEELGHGLFTYVLLEALSGKADGAPKDGKITIYELKSFMDDQVPHYSKELKGKLQFPYTFSRGHDFPIVID